MSSINRIKYFGIEFDYGQVGNVHIEVISEIENNGEVSDVNYKILLNDIDYLDFLTQEEIDDIKNKINNNFNPTFYMQIFKNAIIKKLAGELNLTISGDSSYQPKETLRERIDLIQAALDELILGGVL